MKVTIEFFGQLTDISKTKTFDIAAVTDTDTAMKKLYEKFPSFQFIKFIIAVNNTIIHKNTELNGDTLIALMPPYSGG